MKIKELTEGERPRERLERYGPGSLSSGELLAILLRTGTKDENVVSLAQRLLAAAGGSLVELSRMSLQKLRGLKGFGGMKAAPVLAALELGRRFMAEQMGVDRRTIVSARQIFDMMIPHLKGLGTEECWVILLNSANYVISRSRVSAGGLSSTIIDCRLVVSLALDARAASLILVHNHPSGNPRPGREDIAQTARLKEALQPFGIAMIDHVVICDDCCYSFADDDVYMAM